MWQPSWLSVIVRVGKSIDGSCFSACAGLLEKRRKLSPLSFGGGFLLFGRMRRGHYARCQNGGCACSLSGVVGQMVCLLSELQVDERLHCAGFDLYDQIDGEDKEYYLSPER